MFVRRDWTRRGLGRAILDSCERAARAEGFTTLALMATLPGEPLYRACGFRELERTLVTMPDGVSLEGVAMERPVSPRDAPAWIRTRDLRIRSPLLYPAELRGPGAKAYGAAAVELARAARALRVPLARLLEQAGGAHVAAEVRGVDLLAAQRLVEPLRLAERERLGQQPPAPCARTRPCRRRRARSRQRPSSTIVAWSSASSGSASTRCQLASRSAGRSSGSVSGRTSAM